MTQTPYSPTEYRILWDGKSWAITRPRKRKDKTGKVTIRHVAFKWPGSLELTLLRLAEMLLADKLDDRALTVMEIREEIQIKRGAALSDALSRAVEGVAPTGDSGA